MKPLHAFVTSVALTLGVGCNLVLGIGDLQGTGGASTSTSTSLSSSSASSSSSSTSSSSSSASSSSSTSSSSSSSSSTSSSSASSSSASSSSSTSSSSSSTGSGGGTCTQDSDCAPTGYCPVSTCVPKLADNLSCPRDAACQSGFCNNQSGVCEQPKALGSPCSKDSGCLNAVCGDALAGGKICCNSQCTGDCSGCNAQGACTFAGPGTDPKNKCNVSPGTCNAGTCDGNGFCAVLPNGAPCSGACSFGTGKMQWSVCNSAGMCVAQNDFTCPVANGCDPPATSCRCSSPFDCPYMGGYTCKFNGTASYCVPRASLGQPCQSGQDCYSNQCDTVTCQPGMQTTGNPCLFNEECVSKMCGGAMPLVMPGHCQ